MYLGDGRALGGVGHEDGVEKGAGLRGEPPGWDVDVKGVELSIAGKANRDRDAFARCRHRRVF